MKRAGEESRQDNRQKLSSSSRKNLGCNIESSESPSYSFISGQEDNAGIIHGQFDDSPDDQLATVFNDNVTKNGHPDSNDVGSNKTFLSGEMETSSSCKSLILGDAGTNIVPISNDRIQSHSTDISGPKVSFKAHEPIGYISGNDRKETHLIHRATLQHEQSQLSTFPQNEKMETETPSDCDVLCGRGGKANNHRGNREFRTVVDMYRSEYFAAKKNRKTQISQAIVEAVRARGGRFLKFDKCRGTWNDIGDAKATDKASQALREGAARTMRHILSTQSASSLMSLPAGAARNEDGIPGMSETSLCVGDSRDCISRSECTPPQAGLTISSRGSSSMGKNSAQSFGGRNATQEDEDVSTKRPRLTQPKP